MMRAGPAITATVLLVAMSACGWPAPAPNGAAAYQRYCASCHGPSGRGDGPAAAALTPPPTDLTTLRATLPQLMQVIDGRTTVRAHGTSAMPVWGKVFEQAHLDGAHAKRTTLLRVQALADHVARLTAGGAAAAPR